MKIIILDSIKEGNFKINKDSAGGYGTCNKFGDDFIGKVYSFFVRNFVNYPALATMYVCAILEKKNEVIYTQDINCVKNCDLCLVTSSIVTHETEINNIKKIKARGIYVGVIGAFCTIEPEIYANYSDFVIVGEPEFYFLNNDMSKFILDKKSGIIKVNSKNSLDELPFPSFEKYFKYGGPKAFFISFFKKTIPILLSRGCPYSCFNYCTYPSIQGRLIRRRSDENLIKEMKYWINNYNINNFLFRDPVFSINNKNTIQLCQKLKENKLNVKFGIETHLNNITPELARLLYDCGCRYIEVGIESVTDDVIKSSKRFSIEKEKELYLIKEIEKIGIKIKTMFIYGLPKDTEETCLASLNFAKKINSHYSQFNVFTPYPGTPIFEQYKKYIFTNKFEDYSQSDLIFKHENLDEMQIKLLISKSYKSYYFRSAYILKKIKSMFK